MKDLYSFHESKEDLEKYYEKVKKAYLAIFARCGLSQVKITEASGGTFTKKFSHEFNVITPAGEVDLIYCEKCSFAQNEEVVKVKAGDDCPCCLKKLKKEWDNQYPIGYQTTHSFSLREARAIEVGNIFDLGDKFARDFNLKFRDKEGKERYVVMGCYGIGDTRLLGTVVEVNNDKKGIIWPKEITPYQVHLVNLRNNLLEGTTLGKVVPLSADEFYQKLQKAGVEVLYDEREDVSTGEKLVTADLLGIPVRLVISEKTKGKVEWKERNKEKAELISVEEAIKRIPNY